VKVMHENCQSRLYIVPADRTDIMFPPQDYPSHTIDTDMSSKTLGLPCRLESFTLRLPHSTLVFSVWRRKNHKINHCLALGFRWLGRPCAPHEASLALSTNLSRPDPRSVWYLEVKMPWSARSVRTTEDFSNHASIGPSSSPLMVVTTFLISSHGIIC